MVDIIISIGAIEKEIMINNKTNSTKSFVPGNHGGKYNTKNPLKKYLINNFFDTFKCLLPDVKASDMIAEIGCAEGTMLQTIAQHYPKNGLMACDLDEEEITKAKKKFSSLDDKVRFSVQNAESLTEYKDNSFELVVCCEVLEHVVNPAQALSELVRISNRYLLVSVPNEPIWRILNLMQLKFVSDWGNTPGHLNHWGTRGFQQFLSSQKIDLVAKRLPFPWQMYLLKIDS